MSSISIKTPYYSPWFSAKINRFRQTMIPSERASQEEQNGVNFNFIASSSEELWVQKGCTDYSLTHSLTHSLTL